MLTNELNNVSSEMLDAVLEGSAVFNMTVSVIPLWCIFMKDGILLSTNTWIRVS